MSRPIRPRAQVPAWVLGAAGILTFLAVLEAVPRSGLVDARFLPPTSQITAALAERLRGGDLWVALGQTLTTWVIGLAISLVAGVVLGVLFGMVPVLRRATASTIEFLRPVPSVALIPVAVLLYGTTMQSTLLLVVYASFWQVLLQVLAGVGDVDPVANDTARSFRFSLMTRVRTLVWPTALPYAVTGLRLAASVALILTVTGELLIGTPGIGRLIGVARESGAVPAMYALVVVAGMLGVAVNLLARAFESRALFWHPSVRGEVAA
ncbi:ABC transporter permease [Myceligenerans pegani]|uniref:ABC transporter permease n=1 Tax=Myceligenerans pegani TaxID=2776917 RepID=A0ABR9N5R5_9MICO|nr:ABC transporter permease [Myceligenerans sp. TRM 65318]MBE1879003.1 ABC transporter permease [Myceligenerans sp. TRM 65318]MBE3021274.1 ABC transporter permease [Myceligenerans sp. TRM 65318]